MPRLLKKKKNKHPLQVAFNLPVKAQPPGLVGQHQQHLDHLGGWPCSTRTQGASPACSHVPFGVSITALPKAPHPQDRATPREEHSTLAGFSTAPKSPFKHHILYKTSKASMGLAFHSNHDPPLSRILCKPARAMAKAEHLKLFP